MSTNPRSPMSGAATFSRTNCRAARRDKAITAASSRSAISDKAVTTASCSAKLWRRLDLAKWLGMENVASTIRDRSRFRRAGPRSARR